MQHESRRSNLAGEGEAVSGSGNTQQLRQVVLVETLEHGH